MHYGIVSHGHFDTSAKVATYRLEGSNDQINGDDMERLIREGTEDLDFNAATSEYNTLSTFVRQNWNRLSNEAKAKWTVYEQYAKDQNSHHPFGLFYGTPSPEMGGAYDRMIQQMEAIDFGEDQPVASTSSTSDAEPAADASEASEEPRPVRQPWTAPVNVADVRSTGDIYVLIAQAYRNREVEAENQAREVVNRMETTTAEKGEIRVLQRELQTMRAKDSFSKDDVTKLEGMMKARGILAEGDDLWKDYGFDEAYDEYDDIMSRSKEPSSFDSDAIPLKTTLDSNDDVLTEQEELVNGLNKKFDALEKLVESFMNELGDSDMEINFQLQNASNDLADAAEAKSGAMKLRNRVRDTLRNNVYNG